MLKAFSRSSKAHSTFDVRQDLWDPHHPVLELMRERRRTGSRPGQRAADDDERLGLAIEGGGMRGVVSASMLAALEDRGFHDAFDAVYGCSSGSINAAYFLAGETWYRVSIYYDELSTARFVDLRRFFAGKDILDLHYAFEEVMESLKPLDYDAVLRSPIDLGVAVTLVDQEKTELVKTFRSRNELKEALYAGAWLPLAVKGTADFRGHRAVDGGLLTALPYRLALQDGCTHVLSLHTKAKERAPRPGSVSARVINGYMNRLRPGLGEGYAQAKRQKVVDAEWLRLASKHPSISGPHVLDLTPSPQSPVLRRHEVRKDRLLEAARNAYEVLYAAVESTSTSGVPPFIRAIPRLTIAETTQDPRERARLVEHYHSSASTAVGSVPTP